MGECKRKRIRRVRRWQFWQIQKSLDHFGNGGFLRGTITDDSLFHFARGNFENFQTGFGNGRKDTFVGPGRVNFTTSLYKSFAMTERAHFEFRAESFNTFNHTEFSSIGTTLGGGQYGQANGTWDPRVLELGSKFVF